MTDQKTEVPPEILSYFWGQLSRQDVASFYRGFLSLIEYQYPESTLARFYDQHGLDSGFTKKLPLFVFELMNSGESAPLSPAPVKGEGTTFNFDVYEKSISDIFELRNQYDSYESLNTVSVIEELDYVIEEAKQTLNRIRFLTNASVS